MKDLAGLGVTRGLFSEGMTSAELWRRRGRESATQAKARRATQPSESGQTSAVLAPLMTTGSGRSPRDLGPCCYFLHRVCVSLPQYPSVSQLSFLS